MTDLINILNDGLADRYHIELELGRGGMATVYRARDLKHNRIVAVKVLLPELASVVGPERFLREIQIAANLRHPHILPLLDSGDVGGLPFYVMPFIEGESLRDKLLREKQLPIEEAVQLGREVADALAYAHDKGVVHRDIKPGNIMLDSGHAVVADFGIALATHHFSPSRLTVSGVSPGSPQYMSPEQAAGEEDVDGRSDVYSLGCVLYEALSGDPPFTGRIPQAILAKKLRDSPPSLRTVRDSVPEQLEMVIRKALGRSPADRFRTAAELAAALQAIGDGRPIDPAHRMAGEADSGGASVFWRSAAGVTKVVITLALLFTAVGFITTRVYDVKLGIPAEFTPSRGDFPIVGLQAMVPVLVFACLALAAYWAIGNGWRLLSSGLRRAPGIGDTLDFWKTTASGTLWKVRSSLSPRAVADAFLLIALIAGVVALGLFRELLAAMWSSDTEVLSMSHHSLHKNYNLVLAPLIVALLVAWDSVFRYLRRKGAVGGRVGAARWGSLAWIVFLLCMATAPWRLLWDNNHERALLDGERAYILLETDTDLVIFRAEEGSTARYRKNQDLDLQRFGVIGYLFEDRESFEGGRPGS